MAVFVQGQAAAQDLKTFDWSGFYLGAQAGIVRAANSAALDYPDAAPASGYGFASNNLFYNGGVKDTGLPILFGLNSLGSIGGLDAGFNVQSGAFIFGLEGDVSSVDGTGTSRSAHSPSGHTSVSVTTGLDALITARARTGIAVDRLMFFATAGLAMGHSAIGTDLGYSDTGKSLAQAGASSGFVPGLIGGVGAEYALNDKISLKAESLYYWLEGQEAVANGAGASGGSAATAQPYSVDNGQSGVAVRAGINVHF